MSLRITVVVAIWIIYLSSPSSCQTVFLTVSTVQVGSTASFSCRVSPVSTATTVGFLKEGPPDIPVYSTAVGGVGSYINRVNGTEISRGHYEITLFNATLQDRGSYICNMILGIGTRSDTEELNVEKASVAEISPPSLETTEERKNQTFDCSSGPSYPAVNLTWSCIDVMCTVVHDTPENSTEMPPAVISKLQAMCPLHKSTNCTCEPSSGHSATATVTFVKNGPPTTTGMTEVITTTVPPGGEAALVAALVTLIIISFIGSCSLCIFVCIKYPDKESSLKCIVDCIGIIVVFLCVILGNICGGVLWRTIDRNQDVGIIVLVIILSDLGFFILGIVVGIIKDCKEQTPDKDKVLRDILVKLPNIVLSVATFGGVSAGISIAFSYKNGKTRRASITPEETQTNPRRENSANSKDSAASQSGVPLHEGIGHGTREESDTIPMQKVKKKKKKKPEKHSKEPYIQKVPSPRKLPPLKT